MTKKARQEAVAGYVFVIPAVILLGIFLIYPMIHSLVLSFQKFSYFNVEGAEWIGFQNFRELFESRRFLGSVENTALIAVFVAPISAFVSLMLATLVDQNIKGRTFFRVAFYLPNVTSTVALATIMGFLFRKGAFLVEFFHEAFGFEATSWFASTSLALPLVMIVLVWMYSGFFMLVYLAGLQTIPDQLYEMATLSGANKLQQFFYITIPLLKPTHFLVFLMLTINTFKVFDQPYVISTFGNASVAGGPAGATSTVVIFLYQNAFKYFRMGYASAAAVVLFLAVFILTIIQRRFFEGGGEDEKR